MPNAADQQDCSILNSFRFPIFPKVWVSGEVMREKKWVRMYEEALMEVRHAKMRGRIGNARAEILARIESLKSIPGLHAQEDRAIDDALNALRFLEHEEDRYDENQRRESLEVAMCQLLAISLPAVRT